MSRHGMDSVTRFVEKRKSGDPISEAKSEGGREGSVFSGSNIVASCTEKRSTIVFLKETQHIAECL